jgi:isopenicillin N synthase-like dioxygenase
MSTFSESVPIVDFSRLILGEADPQAAAAIHRACCESGFFYLSNFGIAAEKLAGVEAVMHWFFALPPAVKQSLARSEENSRGYYNNELTKNIRNIKEVFDFKFKINPNLSDDHDVNLTQDGWNQWPDIDGSESFKKMLNDYYGQCGIVALRLLEVLTTNLGAPVETLKGDFHPRHSSFLRLNFYPVTDPLASGMGVETNSADTGNMGVHHHTDAGALTFFRFQSGIG